MATGIDTAQEGHAFAPRRQRWRELLQTPARPGFCFLVHYNDPAIKLPPPTQVRRENVAALIERRWSDYRLNLDRAAWLDDDYVPFLDMITGTEIFAEAFGCPVHWPEGSNPFALPRIHDLRDVAKLKVPELSASTLAYHFDIADALLRRAGPGALLHMVDIQSPMDIAALICEKSAFLMALVDAPEAVKELAAKVRSLLTAFLDEWFRRYGTDYVAHFPSYFMSGGMTLSEDEIGAVNTDMFDEFFRPELAALSERYGGIGIHCCASARHQWERLRTIPGLRLLNLCNPPYLKPADYVEQAYPFFRDTCAQWHCGWTPPGSPETWPSAYPAGSRVVIETWTDKREEALRLCERLHAIRAQAG